MAMALFSKEYFKKHFFGDLVSLSADIVANVRRKLCTMMPRLKSLLSLPSDKTLLERLEATVKDLLLRETDADVLFALQTSIQDLDSTETGVDGVPSMNLEEDRDNERKLREERLIASMEEQLYKIHSVQSSPSKKLSQVPLPNSNRPSSQGRLLPSTNLDSHESIAKRRSESMPPPLARPLHSDLSSLATPEPSRTYSPELSVLKNDGTKNFFDFSLQPGPNTTLSWDSLLEQNKQLDKQQPYSSSLENLDPSAKEFLVDAGVILDNSSNALTSASSMPNLANSNGFQPLKGTASMSNLEGEFSKYLISNAEMEEYEAEYKRCASIIANGSIEQLASTQQNSPNGQDMQNMLITSSTMTYPQTSSIIHQAIPSTPPMGIPRGSPTKTGSQEPKMGSPPPPPPYTSVGNDLTNGVANFAQSTFNNFSKLTSGGTSDIQGSIERLAEKWEAKRKSLIAVASGSFDFEDGQEETTEIAKQQRATIMEQKLQAIKQQGIPKKRSLLKTPSKTSLHSGNAQKRLSLTDQVEAVGQKAMHKFIIEPNQRRKSMEMMINFSDSEDRTTSGESSSEDDPKMNGKFRGMHLNPDRSQPQSLPPYPNTSRSGYPTSTNSSTDDSMITYVSSSSPTRGFSYSSYGSPTHLVVKPVNSNIQNPQQRNMMRLPANPPRSLPQPPRSLPMPPTYRQTPPASNSLIRAPSTSLLSNRSVYSVNKPNNQPKVATSQTVQQNRQLPQPKNTSSRPMYYHQQPSAVLPQPPSPGKKSNLPSVGGGAGNKNTSGAKPISPYIVSVNSPTEPLVSPTDNITNSSGSNVSTGSSSSQSSNEGLGNNSNSGPKYTRVPPPRYRPHQPPLAQRRPLSGGHDQHQQNGQRMNHSQGHTEMYQQGQTQGNLRRYGTKSVSAESVLVNGRQNYNQQQGANMKTSSGGSSSRSSSPQSSNSESQLTPPEEQNGQRNGANRVGIPQGPMRRSSGLRMWQGHMGHQSRAQVAPQPSKNSSRSPSPGHNRANSQPTRNANQPMMQRSRVSSGNEHNYQPNQRGSSLPGAYQMSYGQRQQQSINKTQQSHRSRPNSLHNSPGSSRPSSPQIAMHQKRKSSHYPPGNTQNSRSQQQQYHMRSSESSGIHRTSLSSMHYTSNNAKRQIQHGSAQHKQQQFAASRAYSSESGKMGLPTPGFSSRLPMGASQRSN